MFELVEEVLTVHVEPSRDPRNEILLPGDVQQEVRFRDSWRRLHQYCLIDSVLLQSGFKSSGT